MIATYTGGKALNVREEPDSRAAVVRQLAAGESGQCRAVSGGWADLGDGWADARFLEIRDAQPDGEPDGPNAEPEPEQEPEAEAPEAVGQPAGEPELDDSGLRAKTVPELREFAAQCGVKLRAKSTKDEIIAAILAHD